MVTLANLDGRSLALDLGQAFAPAIQEGKQRREQRELTQLVRQASGLPAVPERNASGFLQRIAPDLASKIQQLSGARNPTLIDQARQEAQVGIETSRRILAAKSPSEKQKIILERASEVQRQGGDASELLRMSGLSADEIDLQAQKTAMTGDATLKALPAPTQQERLSARAELAVRSPQALKLVLHDEAVAREEAARRRAAAAAGRKAANAAAHNAAFNQIIDAVAGTPEAAAAEQQGAPSAQAEVTDEQARIAGQEADPGAPAEEQVSLGREIAQQGAPAAPQAIPTLSARDRFANQVRVANANAEKARELLRHPDKTIRAAAKDAVAYFETQAKEAEESFDFEITAAEAAEVDETGTEEKIRLLQESGLTRDEAVTAAVRTELRTNPVTGSTELVDVATGDVVVSAARQEAIDREAAALEAEVAASEAEPPPGQFEDAATAFGVQGAARNIANIAADAFGAGVPFEQTAEAQQAFRVLRESLTSSIVDAYPGRVPAFLVQNIQNLTPDVGRIFEGPGAAQNKLTALNNSMIRAEDIAVRELERTDLSPTERRNLNGQLLALRTGRQGVRQALSGFRAPRQPGAGVTQSGVNFRVLE